MALPNIFTQSVADTFIGRIEKLNAQTNPQWGKMDVSQMMAHCNVTYAMAFDENYKKSGAFMRFILKNLAKKSIVDESPLKKNGSTAPEMVIKTAKNFAEEKATLISNLQKTVKVGGSFFEGKDHPGFGVMTTPEWNNFYYKHIDHHLTQFGV
ncbi:MAG: DUF1569 domain-containing protein [Emticicia sp.]|nr:DUF1569 domain-containing protein [Emticicia sp.]